MSSYSENINKLRIIYLQKKGKELNQYNQNYKRRQTNTTKLYRIYCEQLYTNNWDN